MFYIVDSFNNHIYSSHRVKEVAQKKFEKLKRSFFKNEQNQNCYCCLIVIESTPLKIKEDVQELDTKFY